MWPGLVMSVGLAMPVRSVVHERSANDRRHRRARRVSAESVYGPLGLTQPTISHHLKVLVDAGIFGRDKRGVWAYYALVPSAMDALSAVLSTGSQPVRA